MKKQLILLTIALVMSVSYQQCSLKLYAKDETNWYNLFYGITSGLYKNQPDPCDFCTTIGNIVKNLQTGYINLESSRSSWINGISTFNSYSFTTKVSKLITVFGLFYYTAIYIDAAYQDGAIQTMIGKIVDRFDDSFAETMQENVYDSAISLFLLWGSAPGSSCESIGIRFGASIRKVFLISWD